MREAKNLEGYGHVSFEVSIVGHIWIEFIKLKVKLRHNPDSKCLPSELSYAYLLAGNECSLYWILQVFTYCHLEGSAD
jgi:hypothetical protein